MSKSKLYAVAFAAALVSGTGAFAAPVVIQDVVDVAATNGPTNGGYNYYWGSNFANYVTPNGMHWGDTVGEGFNTTQMTVDRNNATNTLTIRLRTNFDGSDVFGAIDTRYADLFIDTSGDDAPDNFNLAVTLGYQDVNASVGGVQAYVPGVYGLSGAADYDISREIWGSRTGFIYGGYVNFRNNQPGYNNALALDAPTRLTNNANQLSNLSVAVSAPTSVGGGFYDLTVAITAVSGNLNMFDHFDIFWGTGDCSNDAIWGTVVTDTVNVPAPGAMLLLGFGLIGLAGVRRRLA